MDNVTCAVHVVEPLEHLLGDLLDNMRGYAAVLVTLDQTEQILAEHLKHHTHVRAIRATVAKVVKKGNTVSTPGVLRVSGD